jgi:hypothetical protein
VRWCSPTSVSSYRGPVLPSSEAPAVVDLRDDLHERLRHGLLRSGDPDALLCFGDTPYGRDDLIIWQAALDSLPHSSPRRKQVGAHVERLLARFA